MQIGIIDAGKIGATVGRLWATAGHKVRFAARHPDQLKPLVHDIGENASIGTSKEAARSGKVGFVAETAPLLFEWALEASAPCLEPHAAGPRSRIALPMWSATICHFQ
jgi:hypothetical protein